MKRLVWPVAIAAVVSLFAPGARADHVWGGYHWARSANPVSVTVYDSVTSAWDYALTTAVDDWNVSSVIDTPVAAGDESSRSRKRCDAPTGAIRVCNAGYGRNGWLGVAEIWLSSGSHIAKARVRLNDTYYGMSTYNTPAWRAFVTCQEVGHTYGLDHQDEAFDNANLGTCMDYTNSPQSNQHPNLHDYEQLEAIYAHVELSSSSASGSQSNGQSAGPYTHVTRDGNYTKITHVYPAATH